MFGTPFLGKEVWIHETGFTGRLYGKRKEERRET